MAMGRERMIRNLDRYMLEIHEEDKTVVLMDNYGAGVTITVKRALEWLEVGIEVFNMYNSVALDLLKEWEAENDKNI